VPEIRVDEAIRLSPVRWDDQAALLRHLNETPEIHRYTRTISYPYAAEDADAWLRTVYAHVLERDRCRTWAVRAEWGELIGAIGLEGLKRGDQAELGYWVARPYWGRGIATRAVLRLTRFALQEYRLQRVFALVAVPNQASSRVLMKAGFAQEACRPRHLVRGGEAYDVRVFGLRRA
jgi:RimJ/RimL family protein N-acetyltransferase